MGVLARYWFFVGCLLLLNIQAVTQKYTYEVELAPINIPDLGGLQSYAYGSYDDEWVIVGGRLDGLHRRQPFASFNPSGNNNQIRVVSPKNRQTWSVGLDELSNDLQEQLSSTNMQFYQWKDKLFLTGGYAYSNAKEDFITFPFITVIDIPKLVHAVKNKQGISDCFIQAEDERFAVAGGRMEMIENVFYLVGGHKFMGRYNPMGADHGPGFSQVYTNEVRKFNVNFKPDLEITHLSAIHDELHLRRRDYNLLPLINNGEKELMIFSGVFQKNADLPWLYPVRIGKQDYDPMENFMQHFNHYHCATLPIYHPQSDEMHSLFFGGIAQFYPEANMIVQDNDVPFVKTISDVSRSKGKWRETILETKMPGLLGSGSELILMQNAPQVSEGIIDGDLIGNEFVDVGYIYGGIKSDARNIFWINTGRESEASATIYKVSIRKKPTVRHSELSLEEASLVIYPNPSTKTIKMGVRTMNSLPIEVEVFDLDGTKIGRKVYPQDQVRKGDNFLEFLVDEIDFGAFIYKVKIGNRTVERKVIWSE